MRDEEIRYAVILSVDVQKDVDVRGWWPTHGAWTETEDDDSYDYDHLEGDWEGGHHRKWTADLSEEEMQALVLQFGLHAEDVETLGSLGHPTFGAGWSPAVSFSASDNGYRFVDAYVTPYPEESEGVLDAGVWDRLQAHCLEKWG